MKQSVALIFVGSLIASCAHHRDVRPESNGVNRVVLKAEDKDGAYRSAMSQAEDYCDKVAGGKRPVIINEQNKYTGNMSEENYNTAKTVSKVAEAVGGVGVAFGGKNERTAGGVVGLGGGIADQAIGQGYTYELHFRCQ